MLEESNGLGSTWTLKEKDIMIQSVSWKKETGFKVVSRDRKLRLLKQRIRKDIKSLGDSVYL